MSIHNEFINHPNSNLPDPARLTILGAFFPIEVHVHPQIAQALTERGQPIPQPVEGAAVIDTGAAVTCVHEPILEGVALNPIGVANLGTAAGLVQGRLYPVRIVFPTKGWTIDFTVVAGVNLTGQNVPLDPPQPIIALLGRNLLEHWILIWNGPGGYWSVAT